MISVVIVTHNEANKLEGCLESVKDFLDEILIVDLESTDNTSKICQRFKAKINHHLKVEYVEKVRNFAIEKAQGNWILVLDPDERMSADLRETLTKIVKNEECVAVNIPRKNIFFNSWIKHSNFWPDRHIRFFKKTAVDWPDRIHTYPKVNGEIMQLPAKENLALIHYGYESYGQFLSRQQRYAVVDAGQKLSQNQSILKQILWMPVREFLVRFIKHKAFLDGVHGIFLVFALVWYQLLVGYKMWRGKQK